MYILFEKFSIFEILLREPSVPSKTPSVNLVIVNYINICFFLNRQIS